MLNLLTSLYDEVGYFNLLDGPTNTVNFLEFFHEASQNTTPLTGRPILECGDIIIMDNLSCHEGGEVITLEGQTRIQNIDNKAPKVEKKHENSGKPGFFCFMVKFEFTRRIVKRNTKRASYNAILWKTVDKCAISHLKF